MVTPSSRRRLVVFIIPSFPLHGWEEPCEPEPRPKGRLIELYHRTSDITYLNAEALGWDWGIHSCRPR
jgi:hypothetical protein